MTHSIMALSKQIAEDTRCAQGGMLSRANAVMRHLEPVFAERDQAFAALRTIKGIASANGEALDPK